MARQTFFMARRVWSWLTLFLNWVDLDAESFAPNIAFQFPSSAPSIISRLHLVALHNRRSAERTVSETAPWVSRSQNVIAHSRVLFVAISPHNKNSATLAGRRRIYPTVSTDASTAR